MTAPAEDHEAAFLRRRTKTVALVVFVLALLAAAYPIARWFYEQAVVAHEDAAAEMPVYTAAEAVQNGVDFGALHAELLPTWFVALGQRARDPGAELTARQAVLDALAADPDLSELLTELAELRGRTSLDEALIREQQIVDEWNARLRDRRVPFSLQLPLSGRQRANGLWALSYFVLGDVELEAGERRVPARLLTRVDDLGVVEGYAGHAAESAEVAWVLIDKVAELAADRLWPLLEPQLDNRLPEFHRAFAEGVRAELAAWLPADAYETLQQTASARGELVWTRDSINQRRACGSWFSIRWIPMRGFTSADLDEWRGIATSAGTGICPAVTYGELDVMREASWTLAHTPGVREALHALTAHVARSVAVHEARHVIDFDAELTCPTCPSWMSEASAQEASAYLASISSGAAPTATLFELCELLHEGGSGAHRRAAALLVDRLLDDGCEAGPPADLVARAAALDQALFGHTVPVGLRGTFPAQLRSRRYP